MGIKTYLRVVCAALLSITALQMTTGSGLAATTRQVSPTGVDSGDCSSTPCHTIAYALGQAANGDTISLAAGTYAGGFTISKNVNITGAGASLSVIQGGEPVVTVGSSSAAATVTLAAVTITGAPAIGGIINWGTLTVFGATVAGNAGSNYGGGIINSGALTVWASTITHNTAVRGGGIVNGTPGTVPTSMTMVNSTVSYNIASDSGGGLFDQSYNNNVVATIANSTFTGNTATRGAGISNEACGNHLTLINTTVSGNVATHYGGGVVNAAPPATTAACPNSVVNVSNSIIAGNTLAATGPVSGPDCYGPLGNGGNNVLGIDGYNINGAAYSCGIPGGTAGSPINPKLAPLGNYGGPTQTMALLSGSPAIGAGNTSICANSPINNLDQRGRSRATVTPGTCDVGAYDTDSDSGPPVIPLPHQWYVNSTGSDSVACGTNSLAAPFQTIQRAIACAQDGDAINVAASATPYAGTIDVTKNVSIVGAGENSTTLSGSSPVLHIEATYVASVSGVTITQPSNFQGQDLANDGTLTLSNSIVRGGSIGSGGGIANTWILTVQNSILTRNSGTYGGAIYNRNVLNLIDSTVSNNTVATSGGGIENYGYYWASALIANSTISGNVATGSYGTATGGGFYNSCGDEVFFVNSTVSGNSAKGGNGGGVAFPGGCAVDPIGRAVLSNTILAGNTATTGPDCYVASPNSFSDGTGHNVVGQGDGCTGLANGANGDQIGSSASPLDPKLGPLAGYGGPTQTMGLLSGSPAIGHGDLTTCSTSPISGVDQRGLSRLSNSPSTCDVGAFDTDTTGTTQAVAVPVTAGWNMIGGGPFTLAPDATLAWTFNAATGSWSQPFSPQPTGTGAWEYLASAGTRLVAVQTCSSPVNVTVVAHRWNMVGNPCSVPVSLPAGTQVLTWNGTTYVTTTSIPVGAAAWIKPASNSLPLTPTS